MPKIEDSENTSKKDNRTTAFFKHLKFLHKKYTFRGF